jgi:hypothetical protein
MSELTNRPGKPIRRPDRRHTAGVLDIRNIIGGLLGVYGVILLAVGVFGDAETDKTGGVNANLWAGLVLLAVGLGFLAWARLRPIVVPEVVDQDGSTAE